MSLHSIESHLFAESQLGLRSNEILIANKDVPLSKLVKTGLSVGKLSVAEQKSHGMDEAYFRWQAIRLAGVPLNGKKNETRVTCRTGLEGYFVGSVESPEKLATELLEIGEQIWKGIKLLHKLNYSKRKRLEETILGKGYSSDAAFEWAAILGATIARLRAKLLYNKVGQEFQFSTRQEINGLPKIIYRVNELDSGLVQAYKLPIADKQTIVIDSFGSGDEQKLYWETVQNIGIFGHPLVRALLREMYK